MLTKLTIMPSAKPDFSGDLAGKPYTVMINPEQIHHYVKAEYGQSQQDTVKINPEIVSFELVLDATGVVDPQRTDLTQEMVDLKNTFFDQDFGKKRPRFLDISWGSFSFMGRLSQMDIDYTLFAPNGNPVRARLKLTFEEYIAAGRQSSGVLPESGTSLLSRISRFFSFRKRN
jgi:hypothetical protein